MLLALRRDQEKAMIVLYQLILKLISLNKLTKLKF